MTNRKQILQRLISLVGLGLLCLAPGAAYAATCTSAASASWNVASTWSCGHVPLVGDDVVIAAAHAVTVNANATGKSVSMSGASASTLTINSGYSLAVVGGDITLDGTALPAAARHTINVGAGALSTTGKLVMKGGAGAGNGGVNISVATGSLSVTNTTTLTSGVTRVARITGGAGPITATGTLTLDGRLSTGAGGAAVVTLGAGALYVGGDLILTAGTVANSAVVTRGTGTITVGGGVKLTGGAGTGSATIAGNTGAITIGADLELIGGASASSATIAVGASGPVSVTGSLKMTGGAGIPGAVLTIGTNGVMTAGSGITINNPTANSLISFSGSGTLNTGGNVSDGASFVPGSGVVNYNGAANQTVGAYAYNNLTLSGSLTKTLPNTAMTIGGNLTLSGTAIAKPMAGLTVNGNLVIAAGTTFLADVFTHNIKGNFSGGGTLDPAQGTFNFNGTAPQTLAGPADFYNLTLNNATGVSASGVITILGNITNTAGFTAGTSTVVFSGGDVSTVTGVTTFMNLTIDKSNKELTLNNNASVSGILTLTNLNIITGANTLAITSTGSVTRDPVTGGHVIGNMSRYFPVDASPGGVTRDFAIGTLSGYAPVSMTFFSVTTAGSMTAKTTLLDHPMIDGAVIDPDLDVNLYWTLSKDANIVFENADVTFNFTVNDLDNNAIPQNFIAQSYTPDIWSNTMLLATTDTSIMIGGVTAFGDFAVGPSTLTNFPHEKEFVFTRELY